MSKLVKLTCWGIVFMFIWYNVVYQTVTFMTDSPTVDYVVMKTIMNPQKLLFNNSLLFSTFLYVCMDELNRIEFVIRIRKRESIIIAKYLIYTVIYNFLLFGAIYVFTCLLYGEMIDATKFVFPYVKVLFLNVMFASFFCIFTMSLKKILAMGIVIISSICCISGYLLYTFVKNEDVAFSFLDNTCAHVLISVFVMAYCLLKLRTKEYY